MEVAGIDEGLATDAISWSPWLRVASSSSAACSRASRPVSGRPATPTSSWAAPPPPAGRGVWSGDGAPPPFCGGRLPCTSQTSCSATLPPLAPREGRGWVSDPPARLPIDCKGGRGSTARVTVLSHRVSGICTAPTRLCGGGKPRVGVAVAGSAACPTAGGFPVGGWGRGTDVSPPDASLGHGKHTSPSGPLCRRVTGAGGRGTSGEARSSSPTPSTGAREPADSTPDVAEALVLPLSTESAMLPATPSLIPVTPSSLGTETSRSVSRSTSCLMLLLIIARGSPTLSVPCCSLLPAEVGMAWVGMALEGLSHRLDSMAPTWVERGRGNPGQAACQCGTLSTPWVASPSEPGGRAVLVGMMRWSRAVSVGMVSWRRLCGRHGSASESSILMPRPSLVPGRTPSRRVGR